MLQILRIWFRIRLHIRFKRYLTVIEKNQVIGIITDGDIRRMLNDRITFSDLTAKDIMTKNPKNINSSILVSEALNVLENNAIIQLVVIDENQYRGIIHLHDILKEGIV